MDSQPQRRAPHATLLLTLLWLAFVVRGLWYCALLPPWEGYDEPFHFAALQNVASGRGMPQADTPVSLEVQNSLHLLPLPWELQFQAIPQPLTTYDDFWKLSADDREQRIAAVRALSPDEGDRPATEAILNYESQQAPLYYELFGPVLRWIRALPLLSRVYLLRMLNVLLASALVPLAYWLALRVLRSDRQALGVTAVLVLLPELMVNVARVGNEGLALLVFSALLACAVKVASLPDSWRWWILFGATLGVGLLTKAYFLTAVPAVIAVGFLITFSPRGSTAGHKRIAIVCRSMAALAVAAAIAGAWYRRVHATTGSWSGQGDDVALGRVSLMQKLAAIPHVNWKSGVMSVLISHLWFGGWSFLRLPRPFYVAGLLVIAGGGGGVCARLYRRDDATNETRDVMVLASFYVCFWAGLAYHVLITFLHSGVSASTGWYLYATVAAEVILMAWGLQAFLPVRVVLPGLAVVAAILDLYGTHAFMMPYYTGLSSHASGPVPGALRATLTQLPLVFARLAQFRPHWLGAPVLVGWWLGYWVVTLGTVAVALRLFRKASPKA